MTPAAHRRGEGSLRLAVILAFLALLNLATTVGWHAAAFHHHHHGAGIRAVTRAEAEPDRSDGGSAMHVAAHAVDGAIDLPAQAHVTIVAEEAARNWVSTIASASPEPVHRSLLRPPRS